MGSTVWSRDGRVLDGQSPSVFPGIPTPYVIAFVNPIEDPRARVLTNIVGVDPDDVAVGMPVRATFERSDDGTGGDPVHLPMFTPEN